MISSSKLKNMIEKLKYSTSNLEMLLIKIKLIRITMASMGISDLHLIEMFRSSLKVSSGF